MDVQIAGRVLSTLPAGDDHPYRTGAWRPQTTEWIADDLDVLGDLPADLNGLYLRNTENPIHPAIERYHPFDGDGMVHVVGFENGHAFYRNRFVRTDGFLAEQAAGGPLWAGFAEKPEWSRRADGSHARGPMKDASSTDVVVHNGKALTSFYQCGDLYELDPVSLETLGRADWHGEFPADVGVSAHTKVDPRTGELLFFNYGTTEPFLHYGVVDADDRLVHYTDVPLPGPRLPHDMAFTEKYAIFNDCPLFWLPEALALGKYVPRFFPDLPTRIGVLPRRGTASDIRWFEGAPTYVLHWVNAYEDGDDIVLDGFFQDDPVPPDDGAGSLYQRLFRSLAADRLGTRLHRWRLDLRTGLAKEERLTDTVSEFGVISASTTGLPYRYTYAASARAGWFLFDGIIKHDVVTGREERYQLPPDVYASEAAFAAKPAANAEDDGYLVTITSDVERDLSECLVFDAARLSDGPIARMRLPERISSGTHATWSPAG